MDNSDKSPGLGIRDRRADALGDLKALPDEILCAILEFLSPRDLARLACVSSVMYILCNEEPLWMGISLKRVNGSFQYKGSWKKTMLHLEHLLGEYEEPFRKSLCFDGFNSLFLYRRFYRCHTTLDTFSFDDGNVEKKEISLEDFSLNYDGKKPVLLTGLADTWSARNTWTIDQLVTKYGDIAFKISQRSPGKMKMKFKDYVSYMNIQHDEDPLYVFDDKFGEVAPDLLKDYSVPLLFQEDLFDVLDRDNRPPFRWLIIGPERSGASWHVDPALTSAWNTLLCGRKRWALYPPGRVPLGVTVNVNDEDGDVHVETPSSLQWWLDFYPLLPDEDKPIERTQLPGETIFVPSGWWHCVLNLETTIAVTQNFVNPKNFEFVCLDMAPGYRHKGVVRAGLLALDGDSLEDIERDTLSDKNSLSYPDLTRKEKRVRIHETGENQNHEGTDRVSSKSYDLWKHGFSYDIDFLSTFLDRERDHYSSPWSSGNCIGQREMRQWLSKLWIAKPAMRELIWKGACLALHADKWLECLTKICAFHNLPFPCDDERLPVGTGSNPVYLLADCAVKIFVEGGLETALYGLGAELEFYELLCEVSSPLKNHIPDVLASGIIFFENESYHIVPWDGKGLPCVIAKCNLVSDAWVDSEFPFNVWSKKLFEYRRCRISTSESASSANSRICPYIITKRCKGKIFAQLRDTLSLEDALNLASFLGEQLHNLHLLPCPPLNNLNFLDGVHKVNLPLVSDCLEDVPHKPNVPAEWEIFVRVLGRRKKDVKSRLNMWGDPIPNTLIEKVDEYIPNDFFANLLDLYEDADCLTKVNKPWSWIHSDIMDDNVHMEPSNLIGDGSINGYAVHKKGSWSPSHILDFSDLSIGDPIYDLIPIYLDIFRGDSHLLKQLLESYKLPLVRGMLRGKTVESSNELDRISYRAM
ncbi:F-box protein At1g78280 [Carica papaya]|uniref:F-box protein At1g78280 n=1 Tax=Carica papaya TaxID=3649 RepID=UPI000B8CFAB7|nr:F-box protein At1g78280 [Carica papaya]